MKQQPPIDIDKDITNPILAKVLKDNLETFDAVGMSFEQVSNDIKALVKFLRAKGCNQPCHIDTPHGKLEWGFTQEGSKFKMTLLFEGKELTQTKIACRIKMVQYLAPLTEKVIVELKKFLDGKVQ
jgi:hypothetical protein